MSDLSPKPPRNAPFGSQKITKDRSAERRPGSGEAPFPVDEVFYSRTDDCGVIQSGNYSFKRTSDFNWQELFGAPHNVLRHPDMPKGIFWLLWEALKSGHPIGAYINNQAKDGLNYWVFACIVPCEGGFLSAHVKPTSQIFKLVQSEYAQMLDREATGNLSPEDSGQHFIEALAKLGFASYHQFEAAALAEEVLSRKDLLGQPPDAEILRFKSMLELSRTLKAATETLIEEFDSVRIVPHNMRVMASRLEPNGGPLTILSSSYGAMSHDIAEWFENNVVGDHSIFATLSDSVNSAMFNEGLIGIFRTCDGQLRSERRELESIDIEAECKILGGVMRVYDEKATDNRDQIGDEAGRIKTACKTMSRHVLGLSTARVMCKIESARMGLSGEGLTDIIVQLGRFQERIGKQLDDISKMGEDIRVISAKTYEAADQAKAAA